MCGGGGGCVCDAFVDSLLNVSCKSRVTKPITVYGYNAAVLCCSHQASKGGAYHTGKL